MSIVSYNKLKGTTKVVEDLVIPEIQFLSINNDSLTTINDIVDISYSTSINIPKEFYLKLDESIEFYNSQWVLMTGSYCSYSLTNSEGLKTVYGKIKSTDYGIISNIVSSSILYIIESASIQLIDLRDITSDNADLTDSLTIKVNIALSNPSVLLPQVRISDDILFESASEWVDWDGSSSLYHTISDPTINSNKIVYVQARNIKNENPSMNSGSIYYEYITTTTLPITTTTTLPITTTIDPNIPNIGDSYEGGIVFYILQPEDIGYEEGVIKGLIAAPQSQEIFGYWSNITDTDLPGTSANLLMGNYNSHLIVSQSGHIDGAANSCLLLEYGGYNDWYLPSSDELMKLYLNKQFIDSFYNSYYFSSTQFSSTHCLSIFFGAGFLASFGKDNVAYSRPIRTFTM